jgi:NADH-quinone oxidoreductase subunit M
VGSIILASLLLKLGGYGLLRFTIPMLPYANAYFLPLVYMLGITGIINASLMAIRQSDIKRVIAYSSIAHMNLIVLGIFTNNSYGINGAIYLMLGHGLVSTALFFCVGVLYDRFHTRLIQYYGGLTQLMPKFVLNFLIFSFANMGFPGTVNFIGEFLILLGIMDENFLCGILASMSTVLSAIYSIYLFNRISFGTIKIYIKWNGTIDITTIEFFFLALLAILTILLGIKSKYIISVLLLE